MVTDEDETMHGYLEEEALGLIRSLEHSWVMMRERSNRDKRAIMLEQIAKMEDELDAIRGAGSDSNHPVVIKAIIRNLERHIAKVRIFNTSNNPAYEKDVAVCEKRIADLRQSLGEG